MRRRIIALAVLSVCMTTPAHGQSPAPREPNGNVTAACVAAGSEDCAGGADSERAMAEEGGGVTALRAFDSPAGLHPASVGVLTREDLDALGAATVPELLAGPIAGAYSLNVGIRNDLDRTIRIRGPVGFAGCPRCSPKVLLDGVEVNPAAITALTAEHLERVEVIRGPQASLLYGPDSASGVILLTSRKGLGVTGTRIEAAATVGSVSSPYVDDASLSRSTRVSLDAGFAQGMRFNLGLSRSARAGFVSQYGSQATTASFGFSGQTGDFALSGSARYTDRHFDYPGWAAAYYHLYADGLLPPWGEKIDEDDFGDFRNLTLALQLTYAPVAWWRSRLIVGDDVVEKELRYLPTFELSDSLITSETDRFALPSVRFWSGVERPVMGAAFSAQVGADYRAAHRLRHESVFYATGFSRATNWRGVRIDERAASGGGFAEAQLRFQSGLIFSAGIRGDTHPFFGENFGDWAWSPRLGAALHADLGSGWTAKPRLAWAQAISTPSSDMLTGTLTIEPNPDITPQTTSGWEFGIALFDDDGRFGIDGTLFHQLSTDALGRIEVYQGDTRLLHTNFVGSILNSGGEIAIYWRSDLAELRANAAVVENDVRNRINDRETVVKGDPAPNTTAWLEGQINVGNLIDRDAYVGGRFFHLGERFAYDPRAVYTAHQQGNEPDQDHSWFAGLSGADVFLGGVLYRTLEARVEVRNVTNNLEPEFPEIVIPGRHVRISLRGAF